jgi:hypothetical protein
MVEHTNHSPLPATSAAQSALANLPTTRVRSSSFKYYIHDGNDALRLKLIGEMTQADVAELRGCWRTAKTTLKGRNLVLDLRLLKTVDELAKQWLTAMAEEGACYVPPDYLATCVPGQQSPHIEGTAAQRRPGLFSRLASLFRSARVSAESSTTQAQ